MKKINYPQFSLRQFISGYDEVPLFEVLKGPAVVKHMASSGISARDCETIVSESLDHWQAHSIGSWAVEVKGQLAGWAGFKSLGEGEYELLIVLSPKHWGLGRVIFRELVRLASDEFKLCEIYILLPNTRGTFRSIERLGFKWISEVRFNECVFQKFTLSISQKCNE